MSGCDGQELKSSPPTYDPLERAVLVFSEAYFYDDPDHAMKHRGRREKVLGDMTVGDVYTTFVLKKNQNIKEGLQELADLIRARFTTLLDYYAFANIPPEKVLSSIGRIDLSGGPECSVFDQRKIEKIPVLEDIWSSTINRPNTQNEKSRGLPLGVVLGPSGSGKTFFSLQYLASKFVNGTVPNRVTVYLKPPNGVKFNEQTNSEAATALFNWIKKEILRTTRVSIDRQLQMHVCLIIDEAGAEDVKWWFEEKDMLTALCGEAINLAKSVAVVISGTGLTGRNLSSANDAYFFRMKRWEIPDLARILDNEKGKLFLEANEATETVAKAVFAHPALGALATNGRAAYFLSVAIQAMSGLYSRVSWSYQLDQWAPTLVFQVCYEYIGSNGINDLSRNQRYRVAASIFRALDNLKAGEAKLPKLEGIKQGKETSVASSLLQYNLEIDGRLKILDGELFAYTVTPAIAIVLYAMAGISTHLMGGWKAEEIIAALYAYRQLMGKCMESFLKARVQEMVQSNLYKSKPYEELDQSLSRLRLVSLRKRIQTTVDKVSVPMLGAGTILVNGDINAFADVIAPFCLIQARRVTTKKDQYIDFQLLLELSKSRLTVSTMQDDSRLLQGLVAMWQGNLDPVKFLEQDHDSSQKEDLDRQASQAFPGNLLGIDTRTENENIRFAMMGKVGATKITTDDGTNLSLPSLDGTTWTYMLSTNAKTIKLELSSQVILKISEATIADDRSINTNKLSKKERLVWDKFLMDHVPPSLTIRFLFTRSVHCG